MSTQFSSQSRVFYGALVNPQSLRAYQALPKALICVSAGGVIDWIEEDVAHSSLVQDIMAKHGYLTDSGLDVVELKDGEFIMPGLIDTHTHAPQFPNIGSGQQYELLDWLNNVTFPMESKFENVEFAREVYAPVVRRVLDSGTTTCCYFGSLHLEATQELANIVHAAGQRAFVGKCNMNRNAPQSYLDPSPGASIDRTKALIQHIQELAGSSSHAPPLVQPILTPRFAISCTDDLLSSLSDLASADPNLRIQTHVSENLTEIDFTKSLFPGCSSYTGIYEAHGLLRHNTILAHAVHLEEEEIALIKQRNAGISHCPTSNFNLRSGIAKVGMLLDHNIKLGLGTDVSGGFAYSILTAVQHASIASKIVAMQAPPTSSDSNDHDKVSATRKFANRQLTVEALLYLATLGGAQVCNLEHHVGSLEVGKSFDALLISARDDVGNPGLWERRDVHGEKRLRGDLERFLFCGDDRNIRAVYVQGRLVGGKTFR